MTGIGTISGTMLDWQSNPLPAASTALVAATEIDGPGYGEGYPDASGTYSLQVPAPSVYSVFADADGYTSRYCDQISVPDGGVQILNFNLVLAGAISGTVINASTGLPAIGIDVYAMEVSFPDTCYNATTTDVSGTFYLDDLDATSDADPSGSMYDVYANLTGGIQTQTVPVKPSSWTSINFNS